MYKLVVLDVSFQAVKHHPLGPVEMTSCFGGVMLNNTSYEPVLARNSTSPSLILGEAWEAIDALCK